MSGMNQYDRFGNRLLPSDSGFDTGEWRRPNHLRSTTIESSDGTEIFVSTVFLRIDHAWTDDADPVLWETMIFVDGGMHEEGMRRYSSPRLAAMTHDHVVETARLNGAKVVKDEDHPEMYDFEAPWEKS